MVVKMTTWPPWSPLSSSRKFEAKVVIHKLQGLNVMQLFNTNVKNKRVVVEIKWKGQKGIVGLGPLKLFVKRNFTKEGVFCGDGVFEWNEEFKCVCNFSAQKESLFYPWDMSFTVFYGFNQEARKKVLVGTALLNLAEFVSTAKDRELEMDVPLVVSNATDKGCPSLSLSLKLMELRTVQESSQAARNSIVPVSPSYLETPSPQKDLGSGFRAGLRKVRIFQGTKKACHEEDSNDDRQCIRSSDFEYNYPFDTDSLDEDAEGESEESNGDSSSRSSFNYESLAYANFAGGLLHSNAAINAEGECWIYYKNSTLDVGSMHVEHSTAPVCGQAPMQSFKHGILPWGKRKLSFRSPKRKVKGEPLLKKAYGDEGGDDVDFDRRQLSSSNESSFGWNKSEEGSTTTQSSFSEFGDDSFAVGSWELKEIESRDGSLKLQAQVFFASIDQRSGRAAGESACTALVAVIAHWLQSNQYEVPTKSEFDSLIRDGSLEWRNLCENEEYRQRFPDKHFDLETILQAKIRPLAVIPEKSYIGFFHPEGLEGRDFDFLHGAMSFDSIWEEISLHGAKCHDNCDYSVFIVSWNDHFFVLKVEQDAYYIIDTLGERLYEGCNHAFVVKFDKDATIHRLPTETKASEKSSPEKVSNSKGKNAAESTMQTSSNEAGRSEMEEEIMCKGKEACKEYIKSFLAAIPVRELQADIKKGLKASTPLHHRLQIEFHYTQSTQLAVEHSSEIYDGF